MPAFIIQSHLKGVIFQLHTGICKEVFGVDT